MRCHIAAFFGGFLLDLLLGDPHSLPHPVRLIGRLVTELERRLRGERAGEEYSGRADRGEAERRQGLFLVCLVLLTVGTVAFALLAAAYRVHPRLGMAVECLMTYQILAVKSLRTESMKVRQCLREGDLAGARKAVSMIVGRDTRRLDAEGVVKAAVETVAENTSDGAIAPMLYLAVGGPVLGFLYKAVNTMDSMIGYRNEKYQHFGRAAARLDDAVNFLPARISAALMIAVSFAAGREFSGRGALKIYLRDRRKHASPNSGQTEAVCAGALGVRLSGDAFYFGELVRKPFIGDSLRKAEAEDIRRANRLLYGTAWVCQVLCLAVMGLAA